jgi:acetyl-CoA C-acetyltransferase/acetyl-CoA acyltransferase
MVTSQSSTGVSGRPVVILGGLRTPFTKAGTALKDVSAVELGRVPADEILQRLAIPPEEIDEVVFGNVAQPADAACIARVIGLRLGLPDSIPSLTVHRNCASGMEAVTTAFDHIRFGQSDLVLTGGVESMTNIPFLFPKSYQNKLMRMARAKSLVARLGAMAAFRLRDFKPIFGIEQGLTDAICGLNMGETAEELAREFGISRDEQDAFALESHLRAARAMADGVLAEEIVPVHAPPTFAAVEEDVGPRKNQTLEALAKLRPYFDRLAGTVTVGNACPITDGGVALVVASEEKARQLGREPICRVVSYAYQGCPPDRMGLGPVFSMPRALDAAGLRLEDMERIELNEAFAAQVLSCRRALASAEFARRELGRSEAVGELDPERLNVNGGAIALGHPVGATASRLILTLMLELRRRDLHRGLATLCVGGGQGGAIILERRS